MEQPNTSLETDLDKDGTFHSRLHNGLAGLNTDNCTVELYHDMDNQTPTCTSYEDTNNFTELDLASDTLLDKVCSDYSVRGDDVTISSIWETRWFDHAAHVGRVMAQDKIQSDTSSNQGMARQSNTSSSQGMA